MTPGDDRRGDTSDEGGRESLRDASRKSTGRRAGVLPESRVQRVLTVVLLVLLVVALGGVVYLSLSPPETADPYTEFYVLGTTGNASEYPTNLSVGEAGEFTVGITNHEHGTEQYAVVGTIGDRRIVDRTVSVEDGNTWESTVSFTAREPGVHRLQLGLYVGADRAGEPDQTLRLFVSVRQPNGTGGP